MLQYGHGMAWYIATSTSAAGVQQGTRTPVAAFRSPFLGKDIVDLYGIWRAHFVQPRALEPSAPQAFAANTFCILDGRTLDDRTAVIASDESGSLDAVRCVFAEALYNAVPLEMRTVTIAFLRLRWADEDGVVRAEARDGLTGAPSGWITEYTSDLGVEIEDLTKRREDGERALSGVVRRKGETKWRRIAGDPGGSYDPVTLTDNPTVEFE